MQLTFDGRNDPCSQNKDINFEFKGFTVYGKVSSARSPSGPEGVTVRLLKDKKEIAQTISTQDGNFEFPSVLPGNYVVEASHPKYGMRNFDSPACMYFCCCASNMLNCI